LDLGVQLERPMLIPGVVAGLVLGQAELFNGFR
jgi:hypothetical protein